MVSINNGYTTQTNHKVHRNLRDTCIFHNIAQYHMDCKHIRTLYSIRIFHNMIPTIYNLVVLRKSWFFSPYCFTIFTLSQSFTITTSTDDDFTHHNRKYNR